MNKCVFIIFSGDLTNEKLLAFLQKKAHEGSLEGVVQPDVPNRVKITVCGAKEKIDQFIDSLYDASEKFDITDIEIEPFFKHKDFRGVFRILK